MPAQAVRETHWDLMLEQGEVLLTLELTERPRSLPAGVSTVITARRLADHRKFYLDFEGEVPGARGTVGRDAAGTLHYVPASSNGSLRCRMHAENLDAEIEFLECAPGEATQVTILTWNWN